MIRLTAFSFAVFLFLSCNKAQVNLEQEVPIATANAGFTKYTIAQGKQFCNDNVYVATSYSELKFIAKFDSTAVYTTIDPSNQDDINKLYGFADNNAFHQQFSARFGWRWSNNAVRLFGYTYNNGIRDSKELGTIVIGKEYTCAIKITATSYLFELDGKVVSLARTSTTLKAEGYKLYPYFGGDEMAPHQINISIKEL